MAGKMQIAFLDYETYFATGHSLSNMNPINYVMSPLTELQSLALQLNDGPCEVVFGESEIRYLIKQIDWANTMNVAHNNSGFDAMISAWRLGIKPKAWGCTLAMARPFFGLTVGVSLDKVSEILGFGGKEGQAILAQTKGRYLKDFTASEREQMAFYNRKDTEKCAKIFHALAPKLGRMEMKLIDLTIRMLVEPGLMADRSLLVSALENEHKRKTIALMELAQVAGLDMSLPQDALREEARAMAMSQPKFAALLHSLGAECPMKVSPSNPSKLIPALSKTDPGMQELLEHPDYRVSVAAATRLGVKSSQLETRLLTLISVSDACDGALPVPLNYCGAMVTWRHSGGMKMNMQNNPRVNKKAPKPSDALRQSIVAPEGYVIVVVDSSNIELRIAHMLAGQMDTIAKIRNKEDLYCWFASTMYGRTITKEDELERYLGKQAMLQLQFGAGWKSFQKTVWVNSGHTMKLSEEECKRVVNLWRSMFGRIANPKTGIWKSCEKALEAMMLNQAYKIDPSGLLTTAKDRVILPAGKWLTYPDLHQNLNSTTGRVEWIYGEGRNRAHINAPTVFANCVQSLARHVVMEQTLELAKTYPVKLSAHDEAVFLAPEDEAEQAKAFAVKTFSKSPAWWPDLPLSSEAGYGKTYSAAK